MEHAARLRRVLDLDRVADAAQAERAQRVELRWSEPFFDLTCVTFTLVASVARGSRPRRVGLGARRRRRAVDRLGARLAVARAPARPEHLR